MRPQNSLTFLGTAGARVVMSRQLRSSGGLVLSHNGRLVVIDPGPGTLVRFRAVSPPLEATEIDAVILTHRHIDHSTDTNVMIECMTRGGTRRRGAVFAPEDCLESPDPVVFHYLRPAIDRLETLTPHTEYRLGSLSITTAGYHAHPVQTLGLILETPAGRVALVADSKWMPELLDWYQDSDLLIINVVRHRAHDASWALHLTVPEVEQLIYSIKPELAVLTHFGMSMLNAGPSDIAAGLTAATGVRVVAATDGMVLDLTSTPEVLCSSE